MNSAIARLLCVVLWVMPALVYAQEAELADPVAEAAKLDEPVAESEADKDDSTEQTDEHLRLLDQTGELSRQDIIDALPKGFVLGAAGINIPDRFSENEQNFYAVPGFVYLGDRFFYLGDRASYNLARGEIFSFNLNARYRFAALEPEDEPEFSTLNPRDGELEAGFGLNAVTPFGFFTTRINADVSGQSHGFLANATWFLPYYKKGLLIMPAIGFSWYDSSFSNYYYGGVTPEEANPLIPAFDTGSTTSLNGIFVVGYRFSPHWFVTGGATYSRLSNNVEDSPILLSRNETILFSAVGYIWE